VPVLRFARDQRGYESTYLVGSVRGKGEGQSLLYWFRTPPHVKVGRAAFDEDAIRLLEEQHPDIDFDWDRILAARPPAAPEPRESRYSRPERRPPREGHREDRGKPTAPPRAVAVPAPAAPPPPIVVAPASDEPDPAAAPVATITAVISPIPVPEDPQPVRRFVRVFDRLDQSPLHPLTEPSAAERLLGAEKLTILRARYAEIQARISAHGGDPARLEALREQAERVNPDTWVTDAEVNAGLASVDDICAELHRLVGRRRRRRRRGGRGGGQPGGGLPSQAGEATLADGAAAPDDSEPDAQGDEPPEDPDDR
jgi:hypothetical protein